MKYEHDYKSTSSKKEFIALVMRKYDGIKETTATRRFYDMRKSFGLQLDLKEKVIERMKETIDEDRIIKPNCLKMIIVEDMKNMNIKITKKSLMREGIMPPEINWLIINKVIDDV